MYVAEEINGDLRPAGQIRFGFAGKGLWSELDALRCGVAKRGVVPVSPALRAKVKFFGRYKRGAIRGGVILSLHARTPVRQCVRLDDLPWSCDGDEVIAAFDRADNEYR